MTSPIKLTPAQRKALLWIREHEPVSRFPCDGKAPSVRFVQKLRTAGLVSEVGREDFKWGFMIFKESPRKAAEAASERISNQSLANGPCDAVAERPVLVGSETSSAVAGVLGQPETIPALIGQHASANVSGSERAGVTAGETAPNSPETATKSGQDIQSPSQRATTGENLGVTVVGDESGTVFNSKPYVLRPFCHKPGADDCGGVGSRHCYACEKSKMEAEEAA